MPMTYKSLEGVQFTDWNGRRYYDNGDGNYFIVRQYRGRRRRFYFIQTTCATCGCVMFSERAKHRKAAKEGITYRAACDSKCRIALISGENHHLWSGGRRKKKGRNGNDHILAYAPNHPNSRKGYVPEHRLVVEAHIGRFLEMTEVVHHIDCDASNNDINNLIAIPSDSDHRKAHASVNRCVKELLARGVLEFDRDALEYRVV